MKSLSLNKIYLISILIGVMVTLALLVQGQNATSSTNDDVFSSQPYVYAGVDVKICDSDNFKVNGINTFKTKNMWHTTGDGEFVNPYGLTTIYNPGKEDLANGYAVLSLHLLKYKGPKEEEIYDEMVLYFGKCEVLDYQK